MLEIQRSTFSVLAEWRKHKVASTPDFVLRRLKSSRPTVLNSYPLTFKKYSAYYAMPSLVCLYNTALSPLSFAVKKLFSNGTNLSALVPQS